MAWETKTHTLSYPVEFGAGDDAREIKTVTLRMPNGRNLRRIEALLKSGAMSGGALPPVGEEGPETEVRADGPDIGIDVTLKLITILSDLPEGADDELHIKDIMDLGEAMAPFLEGTLDQLGMKAPSSSGSPDGGAKTAK